MQKSRPVQTFQPVAHWVEVPPWESSACACLPAMPLWLCVPHRTTPQVRVLLTPADGLLFASGAPTGEEEAAQEALPLAPREIFVYVADVEFLAGPDVAVRSDLHLVDPRVRDAVWTAGMVEEGRRNEHDPPAAEGATSAPLGGSQSAVCSELDAICDVVRQSGRPIRLAVAFGTVGRVTQSSLLRLPRRLVIERKVIAEHLRPPIYQPGRRQAKVTDHLTASLHGLEVLEEHPRAFAPDLPLARVPEDLLEVALQQ
mmetsp:Transcript_31317/g.74432  ORF Transcript_31317/g.74432 Transcript_31317/m.74432 type:complete len:257 (+) Transcript_31317:440-1210(+)